nr:IS5/IS1182 family transposase [Phormidium tanganyikae FI6-MK23]
KRSQPDRQYNRQLAQVRIAVEHVNRKLKIFRILSERYRNRRKRFGLRFNLIAGLINYELAHPI